jgi:alanine racemase
VSRPTLARIDLDALAGNYRAIAAFVGAAPGGRRVIAVVKANAYGHGAVPAARALVEAGAPMLACADVDEAVVLRDAGIHAPILVFGALVGFGDADAFFRYGLTPSISTPEGAAALESASRARGERLACHLKVDTGMNRMGLRDDGLAVAARAVLASPHLAVEAAYTHYATADEPGHPLFAAQQRRFADALAALSALGVRPSWTHAANSAAICAGEDAWGGGVRPGLALYGALQPPAGCALTLRPVLSLVTRVAGLKTLRPGDAVGYGARFTAEAARTLAVLPLGYADGIDRRLEGRGHVLVAGRRAPIVGSVCMDMITADVTGLPVAVGDDAVLIGRQGPEALSVIEVAEAAGTIAYEVLCRVGPRVERIYNRAA